VRGLSWQHHVLQKGENHKDGEERVGRPGPVAATTVRADETEPGNTVRLAGSKDAKVTLVNQHDLPGTPDMSVKAK
jgi:hypothetical protein